MGDDVHHSGLTREVIIRSAADWALLLAAMPVSSTTLPPFPWVDWPAALPADERNPERQKNLDAISVLAGEDFRQVEGQVERRVFGIPAAMSQLEVRRNYASLIRQLGGEQVHRFSPIGANKAVVIDVAQADVGRGNGAGACDG